MYEYTQTWTHTHTQTWGFIKLQSNTPHTTCLWMTRTMCQISTETVDLSNMQQKFPFKCRCDYVLLYLIKAYFVTSFPGGFYVTGESSTTSILFDSREITARRAISSTTQSHVPWEKCFSNTNQSICSVIIQVEQGFPGFYICWKSFSTTF